MGGLLLLELLIRGEIRERPTVIVDAFLEEPADMFKNSSCSRRQDRFTGSSRVLPVGRVQGGTSGTALTKSSLDRSTQQTRFKANEYA
jgi:hypothetical protein